MKYLFHILLFIAVLTVSGCASFSKKEFRRDYVKIPKNNISLLNGTYKIYPMEKYGEKTPFSAADSLKRNYNLYNTITGKTVMDNDSIQGIIDRYTVNIIITSGKEIKISLMRDGHVLDEREINGKLQDGMFRLGNSFLSCHGLPYVFGGCHNIKRRLALTTDNHLIVNEAVDNTGAILFFIGSGYSYNSAYRYERVE